MKQCIECKVVVEGYLNRDRCSTCYARYFRAKVQSEESKKNAYEWRKKYREFNKDKIAKWRKEHRQETRAKARLHKISLGTRRSRPRTEEYKAKVAATYKLVSDYKIKKGCIDCGYNKHPQALDFDHVRDKKYEVSALARSNARPETLWAEIAKCVVRCANCHRIMTYNRRMELKEQSATMSA